VPAAIELAQHETSQPQINAALGFLFVAVTLEAMRFQNRADIALEDDAAILRVPGSEISGDDNARSS
jgi:hypothetical protein